MVSGGVCDIGYTFTPTAIGPAPAGQSNLPSNSYNSQQTVLFSTSGSGGYSTVPLPFTLLAETEVYGYSFSESFTFTGAFPASGTMVFYIGSPDALHGPDHQRIGGNHHMQRGGVRPRLRQLHRQLHLHLHQFVLQLGDRNNHPECHQGAPDGHRQQLHPPVRHAQPHLHGHHHRRGQRRRLHRHLLHDSHGLLSGRELRHQRNRYRRRTSPTTTWSSIPAR